MNTQPYYKTKSGRSLYEIADDLGLNSYEFDIMKRVFRCRHKGNFLQDLEKTKGLIDIYITEQTEVQDDMLNDSIKNTKL